MRFIQTLAPIKLVPVKPRIPIEPSLYRREGGRLTKWSIVPIKEVLYKDEELESYVVTVSGTEFFIGAHEEFRELTTKESMLYQNELMVGQKFLLTPTEEALYYADRDIRDLTITAEVGDLFYVDGFSYDSTHGFVPYTLINNIQMELLPTFMMLAVEFETLVEKSSVNLLSSIERNKTNFNY
jgi:hypothetical protein